MSRHLSARMLSHGVDLALNYVVGNGIRFMGAGCETVEKLLSRCMEVGLFPEIIGYGRSRSPVLIYACFFRLSQHSPCVPEPLRAGPPSVADVPPNP